MIALVNPRKIAELAGAERKARIVSVPARVSVGEGREQKRACVRAHMQAIRHESDRAEQQAANNLDDHHGSTEPDDRPGLALAFFVPGAEETVGMPEGGRRRW